MKEHYVYITTNLITEKQYVGDHTINSNQKIYYIGSGLYLKRALKEYKNENFFKEILEWFETRKEASDAQEKYIKQFDTLIPNGYNISPKGGIGIQGCHSEETINKISKSLIGKYPSEAANKRMSEILIGKNLGKHPSKETKQKIQKSNLGKNLGKTPWNKGIKLTEKQLKPYLGRIPWNKGKAGLQHHSEKAKEKISVFRKSTKK